MLPPNQPLTKDAARKLMALDVQDKEILTYEKLDEWYTAWGGQCYVSFSGGKDSTVLAYLAAWYLSSFRTPPWELNLVFVNTGLEYPEIQRFVNEYAAWLRREFPHITVNLFCRTFAWRICNGYPHQRQSHQMAGRRREPQPRWQRQRSWHRQRGRPIPHADRRHGTGQRTVCWV